jgi:Plasmid pRiA4b ORF-3-like protein
MRIAGEERRMLINLRKRSNEKTQNPVNSSPDALYVLDVFIIDSPIADTFIAKNPVISRTIEIKGSNTLEDLHKIIFKAFDRKDEHMYEFQVGGSRPQDSNTPFIRCQDRTLRIADK